MGFEPITNKATICYSTIKLYLSKSMKELNINFYFIPTPRSRRITLLRLHPSYKL